ncbi:MAG: Na+/H+ antiporter NhaC family protein [Phocaeicola sp.]
MINNKIPSPLVSLCPVFLLALLLAMSIYFFGENSLAGASQISLLVATSVCICISMVGYKISWSRFELAFSNNISGISSALIILLVIGAISGAWMISGVIPTLIYYGIQLINPKLFLLSSCIICAIVSVITGSSWTTIATIGVALLGIGEAQGFHLGWTAGAIVSGAYFGDKISPLSDTTVLAASASETPIFTHIRYLVITTVPTMCITLLIFGIAGLNHEVTDTSQITLFVERLSGKFVISAGLFIVPALTLLMILKKLPSLVILFCSAFLALLFAFIYQPHLLQEIAGDEWSGTPALIKGGMMVLFDSTQLDAGDKMVNALISTGGMSGMLNTIWLIICAMCFGGAMTASGMLGSITSLMLRFTKKRFGLVTSTVVSGLLLNVATADQYVSIVLTGSMFKDIYKRRGFESRLLSRTTEDAVTVTSPLVPWSSCGMTQATILGVSTFTYAPYAFFNLISPLMTILIAIIGYKIVQNAPLEEKESH